MIELNHKEEPTTVEKDPITEAFYPLTPEAKGAIEAIEYITDYLRKEEENKIFRDDWKVRQQIFFSNFSFGKFKGVVEKNAKFDFFYEI